MADPQAKGWIATGASYGLGHAAAAFAVERWSHRAAWAMTLGALAFSGALYLIAFTGERWMGMVAPVGGSLMIVGWATVLWNVLNRK